MLLSTWTFCLALCCLPMVLAGVECAAADPTQNEAQNEAQNNQLQAEYFENHVRPLLASKCFSCHGGKKQESDLRLDSRRTILVGGTSGDPAAVVGNPNESLLVQYARREVEGMEMPPDDPLSNAEIAVLERWVTNDLYWPKEDTTVVATMDDRLKKDRSSHWAFQTPKAVRPERSSWPTELQTWPTTLLDEFVADNLATQQMTPSTEADRRTLLRRLKFDLLGLPPTMEEVDAFTNDKRPDAYEQLVERLLSSPSYGERWGRHWLDVARYADTRGYTFGGRDRNYPWAYTYRDYVINAFNQDLPYDQFVVQQLAADKLELGDDNRPLAALGFLTVGRKFNNTHDDIDDRIDAVTRGFVGLTVACARCHDHKYDAIPTEDYYALYGVFDSSQESGPPLIGDAETLNIARQYEQQFNKVNGKLKSYDDNKFAEITKEAHTQITDYLLVTATNAESHQLRPYLVREWRNLMRRKAKPDSPTLMPWFKLAKVADEEFAAASNRLAIELKEESAEFLSPFVREAFIKSPPTSKKALARLYGGVLLDAYKTWKDAGGNDSARGKQPPEVRQLLWYFFDGTAAANIKRDKLQRYLTDAEKEQRENLAQAVEHVRTTEPAAYHRAMVLTDKSKPRDASVFIRGNAARRGDKVQRRTPQLISAEKPSPYKDGSGRLQLAKEITREANPLTARVLVNRVWMHHFGRPLVDTPSDFGIRCESPKQQQLLDYLAEFFVQHGWSTKALHREILRSATYRQSSGDRPECYAVDPENRLLWRSNRRRLEFEVMRDALLFVGGELDPAFGGKAVRQFSKSDGGNRRSVYGYIDRQDLPNLLRVFDFAGPDASAEKRANTTVPQQALFMLNSPFVMKQARSLVSSLDGVAADREFVDAIYRAVLVRAPTSEESRVGLAFLASAETPAAKQTTAVSESSRSPTELTSTELSQREQLAQLLLITNEFCYVD